MVSSRISSDNNSDGNNSNGVQEGQHETKCHGKDKMKQAREVVKAASTTMPAINNNSIGTECREGINSIGSIHHMKDKEGKIPPRAAPTLERTVTPSSIASTTSSSTSTTTSISETTNTTNKMTTNKTNRKRTLEISPGPNA